MQSVFMHTELHVLFAIFFTVDNEHFFVTSICNKVLISQILQGNSISGGVLDEPHMPMLAWNLCLM